MSGVFAKHVRTKKNDLADALSRMQFSRFNRLLTKKRKVMQKKAVDLPTEIWPIEKIWVF